MVFTMSMKECVRMSEERDAYWLRSFDLDAMQVSCLLLTHILSTLGLSRMTLINIFK